MSSYNDWIFFFNFSQSFCKKGVGLYWSSSLFQVRIHLFCLLHKLMILFPYKKTRKIFNWLQIHWTPKRRSLLLHYEPSTMLIFCALRVTCPLCKIQLIATCYLKMHSSVWTLYYESHVMLRLSRHHVLNFSFVNRYCESRRNVLLDHVHEGYEKDLWEYYNDYWYI